MCVWTVYRGNKVHPHEVSKQQVKVQGNTQFSGHWSKYWDRVCTPLVVVAQSLSCAWLFATPWTAAHQASLFFTVSKSLLKLMSTESVMPSNHFILCHLLLLLTSIFPSMRVFSNASLRCLHQVAKVLSLSFSWLIFASVAIFILSLSQSLSYLFK